MPRLLLAFLIGNCFAPEKTSQNTTIIENTQLTETERVEKAKEHNQKIKLLSDQFIWFNIFDFCNICSEITTQRTCKTLCDLSRTRNDASAKFPNNELRINLNELPFLLRLGRSKPELGFILTMDQNRPKKIISLRTTRNQLIENGETEQLSPFYIKFLTIDQQDTSIELPNMFFGDIDIGSLDQNNMSSTNPLNLNCGPRTVWHVSLSENCKELSQIGNTSVDFGNAQLEKIGDVVFHRLNKPKNRNFNILEVPPMLNIVLSQHTELKSIGHNFLLQATKIQKLILSENIETIDESFC